MDVARYHHEQTLPNSCLAACATMVRLRIGDLDPDAADAYERSLMRCLGSGRGGLFVEAVARELSAQSFTADVDDPDNIIRIQADLRAEQWWHVVVVGSLEIGDIHRGLGPTLRPRHGAISPPIGPPHAVVLTGYSDTGLVFLDPWLARSHQPLTISAEQFARAWTGMFIPVSMT